MRIPFFIFGGIVLFLILAWVVKLLWNWLIPVLFKGPEIHYKHAVGVLILSRLLFGFGFAGRYPVNYWRNHQTDSYHWNWQDHHKRKPVSSYTPDNNGGENKNDSTN